MCGGSEEELKPGGLVVDRRTSEVGIIIRTLNGQQATVYEIQPYGGPRGHARASAGEWLRPPMPEEALFSVSVDFFANGVRCGARRWTVAALCREEAEGLVERMLITPFHGNDEAPRNDEVYMISADPVDAPEAQQEAFSPMI